MIIDTADACTKMNVRIPYTVTAFESQFGKKLTENKKANKKVTSNTTYIATFFKAYSEKRSSMQMM